MKEASKERMLQAWSWEGRLCEGCACSLRSKRCQQHSRMPEGLRYIPKNLCIWKDGSAKHLQE